ncbi:hypothetical protein [Streptomyces lateritius]|uniref:hypothetical protein n=1 Tax=Streptomyces lateritius TaxID=67313 RepID=UPI001C8CB1AE|nr:hypothetical protein [Streptomyces lateritius]MBX9427665.1 hypothetical protein [Streptomyces lateritius]
MDGPDTIKWRERGNGLRYRETPAEGGASDWPSTPSCPLPIPPESGFRSELTLVSLTVEPGAVAGRVKEDSKSADVADRTGVAFVSGLGRWLSSVTNQRKRQLNWNVADARNRLRNRLRERMGNRLAFRLCVMKSMTAYPPNLECEVEVCRAS